MYDKHEQMEAGSVDEHSSKSDEEYDDLAMRDVTENGYWSDDEQQGLKKPPTLGAADDGDAMEGEYKHSLDLFLEMTKRVQRCHAHTPSWLVETVAVMPRSGEDTRATRYGCIDRLPGNSSARLFCEVAAFEVLAHSC